MYKYIKEKQNALILFTLNMYICMYVSMCTYVCIHTLAFICALVRINALLILCKYSKPNHDMLKFKIMTYFSWCRPPRFSEIQVRARGSHASYCVCKVFFSSFILSAVCIYVCGCICIYVCMYVCIYIYIYVCMYVYIYIYIYIKICIID